MLLIVGDIPSYSTFHRLPDFLETPGFRQRYAFAIHQSQTPGCLQREIPALFKGTTILKIPARMGPPKALAFS
jgi:hypothetical protein